MSKTRGPIGLPVVEVSHVTQGLALLLVERGNDLELVKSRFREAASDIDASLWDRIEDLAATLADLLGVEPWPEATQICDACGVPH